MKETNMEHFRSEIENANYKFGVVCGQVVKCYAERCPHCDFFGKKQCITGAVKWLMSPYKPKPVLTQREKGFVECIRHGWIAADEVGSKMWYEDKPKKDKEPNVWLGKKIVTLNDDYFPFITWEDEEAWAVEDLRKLKVQE